MHSLIINSLFRQSIRFSAIKSSFKTWWVAHCVTELFSRICIIFVPLIEIFHLIFPSFKLFDNIRQSKPESLKKIKLISGDIIEDNLGISEKDEIEIIQNVNIIFHCAARAKFSLTLRDALTFNTLGTLTILQLAEKMKNLIVFSHFSTVYCNPNEKVLHEKYTPATADPYEVIKLLTSSKSADLDDAEARWVTVRNWKICYTLLRYALSVLCGLEWVFCSRATNTWGAIFSKKNKRKSYKLFFWNFPEIFEFWKPLN